VKTPGLRRWIGLVAVASAGLLSGCYYTPYGYYWGGYPNPYPYAAAYPYAPGYPNAPGPGYPNPPAYPYPPTSPAVPPDQPQPAPGAPQPLNEPVERAPLLSSPAP
jgi:hypothetical protein